MSRISVFRLSGIALILAIVACSSPAASPPGSPPATLPPTEPSTLATDTPAAAPPASLDFDAIKPGIDAAASSYLSAEKAGACSLAVVYPDSAGGAPQTQFLDYGTLSSTSSTPVNSSTEYEIGSITKLFTADLLALFVQSGLMKLDDPLQKYFGSSAKVPTFGGKEITLVEMATHTSGLPRMPGDPKKPAMVDGVLTAGLYPEKEFLAYLNTYKLERAPGSKYEYSNYAFGLLAMAEERAGNDGYEALVTAKITGPLGMPDTRITLTAAGKANLALDKGQPSEALTGGMLGAGAFRSNTRDMAVFLIANMDPGGTPLAPVLELTQKPQANASSPKSAMGLAWQIGNPGTTSELFNKSGSTHGYHSFIAFSRVSRTGFVLLCKTESAPQQFLMQIQKLLGLGGQQVDDND